MRLWILASILLSLGCGSREAPTATAAVSSPSASPATRASPCATGLECFRLSYEVVAADKAAGKGKVRGFALLGRACELGYARACEVLASYVRLGDSDAERHCRERACAPRAEALWAARCRPGPPKPNRAPVHRDLGAQPRAEEDLGSMAPKHACRGLALIAASRGDLFTMASFLRRGCELGSGLSCSLLADAIDEGHVRASGFHELPALRARAEALEWRMESEELWP